LNHEDDFKEFQILFSDIPDIELRESKCYNPQVFTAVLRSIPVPIQVQWSVRNEETGCWIPIDINSEEYRGTKDSLPQPVLVVNRKEKIKPHSFLIEVKNFIGTKSKLIPGMKLLYKGQS
jgi:hypothetical protein